MMLLLQANGWVKMPLDEKMLKVAFYRIFMPGKLKYHEHCFKNNNENSYAVTPA